MSDKNILAQWTYDHFLSLLLLYASYADFDYSPEEKEHILSYVPSDTLSEVEATFDKLGDYEQLQLIMTLKTQYIRSAKDKTKILSILKNHFASDGDYSKLESGLHQFLDRLL